MEIKMYKIIIIVLLLTGCMNSQPQYESRQEWISETPEPLEPMLIYEHLCEVWVEGEKSNENITGTQIPINSSLIFKEFRRYEYPNCTGRYSIPLTILGEEEPQETQTKGNNGE
jgi:hypothetical protein